MKKIAITVLLSCLVVVLCTSCASLFGGGDWKAEVSKTVVTKYDEFTQVTEYSMKEAGLYYAYFPIKIEYTFDPNTPEKFNWMIYVENKVANAKSLFVTECSILNSRNERFLLKNMAKYSGIDNLNAGFCPVKIDDIDTLYNVMKDSDNLDYVKIRFSEKEIYNMTQPQIHALVNFIDYVKANSPEFKK